MGGMWGSGGAIIGGGMVRAAFWRCHWMKWEMATWLGPRLKRGSGESGGAPPMLLLAAPKPPTMGGACLMSEKPLYRPATLPRPRPPP